MISSVSPKKVLVFLLCFFLYFSFLTPISSSQTSALSVNITPKYPGPFQTVSISVEDFSRDLNTVNVSWRLNGEVKQQGVGLKRFQFKTGALGTTNNVSINMGGEIHQTTIRPSVVDLIWQAGSYTPPFYSGKALHSNQDPFVVTAEPFFVTSQGSRLDPDQLIYKWSLDGKLDNNASGYGKRAFKVKPSILLKPLAIAVEVSSTDSGYVSGNSIVIPDSKTETIIYENHPLYGVVFERALNDRVFSIEEREVSLIAEPYFFSNQQKDFGGLLYRWTLNNAPLSQVGNEVVFRKLEDAAQGRSSVSIAVKNLERLMQSSTASVSVNFEEKAAENSNGPSQNIF